MEIKAVLALKCGITLSQVFFYSLKTKHRQPYAKMSYLQKASFEKKGKTVYDFYLIKDKRYFYLNEE